MLWTTSLFSAGQASFGRKEGDEGLPVSCPSLPTGRRAELCPGHTEGPLSEQLAPSELYSRLLRMQVEGVGVRAHIGFFF